MHTNLTSYSDNGSNCNTVDLHQSTAGGLVAAIKVHIIEDSSCLPQAHGYQYTGNNNTSPHPETLPDEALDLFPKPNMLWPWKLAAADATPAAADKWQAACAADAAACSPGGRSVGRAQRSPSWCSSPAGSEWAPEAAVLSPECEHRLSMSIKQGLLEELRSEYELKQMETEADCVARIVAVEMSCTDKIATLAQQHHVGLERIKQLVKSKAARFQKALKLETATAYRAGYKAAMRRQAASSPGTTPTRRNLQDSPEPAATRSEAQQLRTAGNQSARAGQQQESPAGQRRKVKACTCISTSVQHSPGNDAGTSPGSSSPKERFVKVSSRVAPKLAQNSAQALSAAGAAGAGAAVGRLRMDTSPLPAHVHAHPSPQLLLAACLHVSKDDSRVPGCQAGSHDDQQDPALIPLPVSLLSKLTAVPATAAADATAAAADAGPADGADVTADATAEADATATMGPGSAVPVGGGLFGARVAGFSEYGFSYDGLHRGFSEASFGEGLFAEPSYTLFTPGTVFVGLGLQQEVSKASLGEGLFTEPSYTAFSPGILLGPAPSRMPTAQPVCGAFAGPAQTATATAVSGALGAAAGAQAGLTVGDGNSKNGLYGDGDRGFSRVLQPLGDVGNLLAGGGAAGFWKIGVSPIGSRRQVSRAASIAAQGENAGVEGAKSSVMQLFELPALENLL